MDKKPHLKSGLKKIEIVMSELSHEVASQYLDFLHEFQSFGQCKNIS